MGKPTAIAIAVAIPVLEILIVGINNSTLNSIAKIVKAKKTK